MIKTLNSLLHTGGHQFKIDNIKLNYITVETIWHCFSNPYIIKTFFISEVKGKKKGFNNVGIPETMPDCLHFLCCHGYHHVICSHRTCTMLAECMHTSKGNLLQGICLNAMETMPRWDTLGGLQLHYQHCGGGGFWKIKVP